MAGRRALFPDLNFLREEIGLGKVDISRLCEGRPSSQTILSWENGKPGTANLVSRVFNVIDKQSQKQGNQPLDRRRYIFIYEPELIDESGHASVFVGLDKLRSGLPVKPSELASEIGITAAEYRKIEGTGGGLHAACAKRTMEEVVKSIGSRINIPDNSVYEFKINKN